MSNPLAAAWDDAAADYDQKLAHMTNLFALDMVRMCNLKESDTLLDVAAGSGVVALAAAPLCKHVLATDLSPKMLEILSANANHKGIKNITTKVADAATLGDSVAEFGFFDVCTSNFGVIFLPDVAEGIRQMMQVTKPGGCVVVSGWGVSEEVPVLSVVGSAAQRVLSADVLAAHKQIFVRAEMSVEILTDLFQSVGLQEVRVKRIVHQFKATNGADFWERITLGSPRIKSMVSSLSAADRETLRNEVIRHLDQQFPNGNVSVDGTAYIGFGRRPQAE